jgi:excisionase family DNA binding protein
VPAAPRTTQRPVTVSIDDAAALTSLSRRTLQNLIRLGALPAMKVGARTILRIADLEAWAARQPAAATTVAPLSADRHTAVGGDGGA